MDIKAQRDKRLGKIRELIKKENLFGYLVPSWDEYGAGECSSNLKRLEYVIGFSGSNGIAIITQDQILLMTDGRYLAQAAIELCGSNYLIINQSESDYSKHLPLDVLVGYDAKLFTKKHISFLNGLRLVKIAENFVDTIWTERDQKSKSQYFEYSAVYSGISAQAKIALCTEFMKQQDAQYLVITDPITSNWILNIRGNDLIHTPVLLSRAIIKKEKVLFFVRNAESFVPLEEWQDLVEILEEESFEQSLLNLNASTAVVDPKSTAVHFIELLSQKHHAIERTSPVEMHKACKNTTELEWARLRHIQDAVALCEAFAELVEICLSGGVSFKEYDVTQLLVKYRQLSQGYICESFAAICGFRENGAIIHYRPDLQNSKILSQGIILIDSGGHYLGGTTDVTRNLVLGGLATQEQKIKYTQVLKGHIALASASFPKGTTGKHLDVLARQFLRHDGYDYPHGTGHGVGNCLSVHEGPQNISSISDVILQSGMILSNEPGYYKEGEYGIRIENLCYIKESDLLKGFLCFEQLTVVPYCSALLEFSALSIQEMSFLKNYYYQIQKLVVPLLSHRAKKWCMDEIENVLVRI